MMKADTSTLKLKSGVREEFKASIIKKICHVWNVLRVQKGKSDFIDGFTNEVHIAENLTVGPTIIGPLRIYLFVFQITFNFFFGSLR